MIYARAALIGCGMVGGSLMAALRAAGKIRRIVGFDVEPYHAASAQAAGIIDEVAVDAAAAVSGCELVVIAVPVRAAEALFAEIAHSIGTAHLVTDVGSTKSAIVAAAEAQLHDPSRFCGAHPIAGTEKSGPEAADAALFAGKLTLLTPGERTAEDARVACEALWTAAGARTRTMTAAVHDHAMAWVSHLPHVAAFALAAAVGGVADDVGGLSGGGFADTTRIAASNPAMWRDIFLANRAALLEVIDAFEEEVAVLRGAIEAGDEAGIEALLARAREGRARVMR